MQLKSELSLEVVWRDDHMFEVKAVASNGRYLGTTEVYEQTDPLLKLAESLKGFPNSRDHKVEYDAGEKDSYAYFAMKFYCINSTLHTALQIQFEENVETQYRPEEKDKLTMELLFEASYLDKFVGELEALAKNQSGKATLVGKIA